MINKSYCFTALLIGSTILMLTNCSTVSRQPTNQTSLNVPFVETAEVYLDKANSAESQEKSELKIKAAGRLIYDRHIQDGVQILKNLDLRNTVLADQKRVLMAKANLMVNNPGRASFYLSRIKHKNQLSPFYHKLYRQLLIDSYERRGRAVEAIEERIKLDKHIQPSEEKIANNKHIWLDLIKMPQAELQTLAIEAIDPNIQGWASLASMAQQQNIPSIGQWQLTYPDHEANQLLFTSNLLAPQPVRAKQIALLLPLSGSLSGPGNAIRDGFVDAKSQYSKPIMFRTYNVANGSVIEQYNKAIEEGADMIIGPLSKDQVDVIARQSHPVPTLLLNYASGNVSSNAWEFGLSPRDEVLQLADKLTEEGFRNAIVISPKGHWGDQVTTTFNQRWLQKGNRVVEHLTVSKDTKFNQAIRHLLHIDNSAAREKALKRLIGRRVKGNLRRRQDFDVVVLLTHSSKARQIVPLLKYYYMGDTPVYGISAVHAADLRVADNRDLDGVIFPDVAYIYQSEKLFPRHWPEKLNSYNRLFAIGRDSFLISQNLDKILKFPAINLHEGDDTVYLKNPSQINYQLNWGKFVDGKAKRLS